MNLLVLGGTGFLSRAVAEAALDRGWSVTTFTRGHRPDVVGAAAVHGDRHDPRAVASLVRATSPWDAVIDCSGYIPRNVLEVSTALAPRIGSYLFVSSLSAYAGWPSEPLDEGSDLLECPADAGPAYGADVENGPTRYGYQKAGAERAVRLAVGHDRAIILRPGVMLGPREYVGRLPWWLDRVSRGGNVVAPAPPERGIQPVDVRDVADFALDCVERGAAGAFNVTAPKGRSSFRDLLAACCDVTSSWPTIHWFSDAELLREGVRQWSELPLWRVGAGVWEVDSSRAFEAGLRCRPLLATVRGTWEWMTSTDEWREVLSDRADELGLTSEHEAALLRTRISV